MILALMPLGVEHLENRSRHSNAVSVILALMPLGVEHSCVRDVWKKSAGDPRIDAVRR